MTDNTYPLFPVMSFLGFILALIPLPWHLQAWNSGTCYFMLWAALACLNKFVNSIIWVGNVSNSFPAICEISTRVTIGASIGIPAASLCINRRLYKIARVSAVSITREEKRRAVLVDSLVCVVLPCFCIALSYIVQGHRYDIFEDLGCRPAIFNTVPAYFLVFMWPIVIGLVSAVYCVMSLRALIARQAQFNRFLSSNPSLTAGRYFRLMALAFTDLILTVPFGCYEVYSNAVGSEVQPWRGWADAHFNFSRVGTISALLWRAEPSTYIALELDRWTAPACAFIFFLYFGFAEEARRNYAKTFRMAVSPFRKLFSKPDSNFGKQKIHDEPTKTLPSHQTSSSSVEFFPPYTSHADAQGFFISIGEKKEKAEPESDLSQTPSSSRSFIHLDVPSSPSSSLTLTQDDTFSYRAKSFYHAV